jgi:hypothetical protein
MAGATVAGGGSAMAPRRYEGPIHVNITAMVESNNGASFQWYFSNEQCFSGIFLKMGSFNGMDPILPSLYQYYAT